MTDHCIEVATHRHGCCVLQRCVDHACEAQKYQLINEIVRHSLRLVQDPFGNYVVQYVLDIGESRYISAIVRNFVGNICALSTQKFSSNVIEKSIRVSDPETRTRLIGELLNRERLEGLLKDLYANYVVQTALDCADSVQRANLIEYIKPLLPAIRNTPFGKRIQSKIMRDPSMQYYQQQQQQQSQQTYALEMFNQPQKQEQTYNYVNHQLGAMYL